MKRSLLATAGAIALCGLLPGAANAAIVGDGYRSLPEGAKVSYEAEAGDKGPKATNVQLA